MLGEFATPVENRDGQLIPGQHMEDGDIFDLFDEVDIQTVSRVRDFECDLSMSFFVSAAKGSQKNF